MSNATRIAAVLTLVSAGGLSAQELPTTQPAYLTIFIEEVKPGHETAHENNEAGWPTAFERAGSTSYYLAMESLTGPSHVWFVTPYASYAAEAADWKMIDENAALSEELKRLWANDSEHLVAARTVNLIARPDLSHGTFPDLTRARFWEITTMEVRPGHEEAFAEAAKVYASVASRGAPGASWRIYQVMAGMPGARFVIFTSFEEYAGFDDMVAGGNAMMAQSTAQEREALQQFSRESMLGFETHRYALNPRMSYVDAATKAADPDFWAKR